jgi:hypothetical protein
VDARFDQDEAEFGVFIFAVALKVLANGNGLAVVSGLSKS